MSIDAIDCQKAIVHQIIAKKGHYLLAVKSNQASLYENIACAFKANKLDSLSQDWEYECSHFESRRCSIRNLVSVGKS